MTDDVVQSDQLNQPFPDQIEEGEMLIDAEEFEEPPHVLLSKR